MAALVGLLLLVFFVGARPTFTRLDLIVEDSADYAFGAASLLHGQYVVDWDGGVPRVPRYTPGFPAMLAPAVALGGIDAAAWVPYLGALALGGLVAAVAARLGGALTAPVAVAAVLLHRDVISYARVVMSDLPSATLATAELALLLLAARRGRRLPIVLAGLIAGYLPLMRPSLILFLLAGVAALSALPNWRRNTSLYLLSSAPLLLALGLWQWLQFGSPFVTGYQAQGASSDGTSAIGALFAPRFIFGLPWNVSGNVSPSVAPNALVYPLHLLGLDGSSLLPGLGAIGLIALLLWARQSGAAGVVGRFGLASLAVTLATYLPYFWQDTRFLMTPTILLTFAGAVALVRLLLARSRTAPARMRVAPSHA